MPFIIELRIERRAFLEATISLSGKGNRTESYVEKKLYAYMLHVYVLDIEYHFSFPHFLSMQCLLISGFRISFASMSTFLLFLDFFMKMAK